MASETASRTGARASALGYLLDAEGVPLTDDAGNIFNDGESMVVGSHRYFVRRIKTHVVRFDWNTMRKLPAKDPQEKIVIEMDFTEELGADSLSGDPTSSVTVYEGTDANANAVLYSPTLIDSTGKRLLVPVQGGVNGVTYAVKGVCSTTNPLLVLSITALIPVKEGA